jgi:uncharacterized 2Fe-2S/4Fe-4S cluster protein (DUF4445 family)
MPKSKVTFLPDEQTAEVERGASILAAAGQLGLAIASPCGGNATCGRCQVRVEQGIWEPNEAEKRLLTSEELAQGFRLACQGHPVGEVVVVVPEFSRTAIHQIAVEGIGTQVEVEPAVRKVFLRLPPPSVRDLRSDLSRLLAGIGSPDLALDSNPEFLREAAAAIRRANFRVTAVVADSKVIAVEEGDTSAKCYGIAADIGTSTIVAYLMRLDTGERVAVAATPNPQSRHGEDVISRVQFTQTHPDGTARLQAQGRDALNRLIGQVCKQAGALPRDIWEFVFVGNSCMTHLLMGVAPQGLGMAPYVPAFSCAQHIPASSLGLIANPRARAYVLPGIAGFVGADTVGVILATRLWEGEGLRVAVDIGTNGEVVVGDGARLLAASGAAGPAFEGARISCGMPAVAGAIDTLKIADGFVLTTIAGARARGICGSGLVDAAAELLRAGVVQPDGRLGAAEGAALPEWLSARVRGKGAGASVELVTAQESGSRAIRLTAKDFRELQLAKAAIAAAISLLLDKIQASYHDVEELLLAGAFGNYIRPASALAIGLLPPVASERIRPVGNAAGAGAQIALLSLPLRRQAEHIAKSVEYVELCDEPGFYERFAEYMALAPSQPVAG